jgi:hypothetical protein
MAYHHNLVPRQIQPGVEDAGGGAWEDDSSARVHTGLVRERFSAGKR